MPEESTQTIIEQIQAEIEALLRAMGMDRIQVEAEETVIKGWVFNISASASSFMLIGRQGATLHALEHIARAIVTKRFDRHDIRFSLDVDDYARKREWFLKETVRQALEQAKRTGRAVGLPPMPNYERRAIHAILQQYYPEAESSSSGIEPRRRVVIRIKK